MKLRLISIRFALLTAAGLAASSLQALPPVAVVSASATLSDVQVGSTYDYTLTLHNTGNVPIESLWYGWTTSGDNLPTTPNTIANSLGWNNSPVGPSIEFTGSSGTALAPNGSATFTFDSTDTPAQFTSGNAGKSVAYVGAIDGTQNSSGDSSPVFDPVLTATPEPSTLGLFFAGLVGLSASGWRKLLGK